MRMRRIYLDHNATTPVHPRVQQAMLPYLTEHFGNPSSLHHEGRIVRDAIEAARRQVAQLLACAPEEIVFTSGGTEADQLALLGAARALRHRTGRNVLVSSPIEHPAVLRSLELLTREGFRLRLLPVTQYGTLDLAALDTLLTPEAALVSIALANHELGTIHPLGEVAQHAHAQGALVHCDAVQAAGKLPLDVAALGADLLTLSAHKIYGPKGAGALYVRRGVALEPQLVGGMQERGLRGGTENPVAIVGLGAAAALAHERLQAHPQPAPVAALRDRLEAGALGIAGAMRFGGGPRVPGTSNLGFAGADGELVLGSLDLAGVSVATGAACSSGSLAPSPVLLALGLPPQTARLAVRFSLGWDTTAAEIDQVLDLLPGIIARIRHA